MADQGWWTDDRVEILKKHWLAGLSAGKIAKEIRTSRGAVSGKLDRLGLYDDGRQKPAKPQKFKPVSAAYTKVANRAPCPKLLAPSEPALKCEPLPFEIDPPGQYALLDLGAHMCRWPIGDPSDADFGFCGARARGSYCKAHARRAVQR